MNHLDLACRLSCRCFSEASNPGRVEFNRENPGSATGQCQGERARAGTYVDDESAPLDADLGDESVCEISSEEVLPEETTSIVPGRPATAGHGAPSHTPTCVAVQQL